MGSYRAIEARHFFAPGEFVQEQHASRFPEEKWMDVLKTANRTPHVPPSFLPAARM